VHRKGGTPQRPKEIGITQVSLNFAMSGSVFERGAMLGAGPVPAESRHRAVAPYRPIWEPRFMPALPTGMRRRHLEPTR
jgi:hypothetical protein